MLLSFVSRAPEPDARRARSAGDSAAGAEAVARRSVTTGLLYAEISLSELDTRSLQGLRRHRPGGRRGDHRGLGRPAEPDAAGHGTAERAGGGRPRRAGGGPGGPGRGSSSAGSWRSVPREASPRCGRSSLPRLSGLGATTLDVGVFGRVELGEIVADQRHVRRRVLPVGATPVTAVPLRVGRGPHSVEVRFRDGRSEQIPLSALPELATEEKNPQNARGVRSIEVTVPTRPACGCSTRRGSARSLRAGPPRPSRGCPVRLRLGSRGGGHAFGPWTRPRSSPGCDTPA